MKYNIKNISGVGMVSSSHIKDAEEDSGEDNLADLKEDPRDKTTEKSKCN